MLIRILENMRKEKQGGGGGAGKQRMFVHSLEFDSCFVNVGKMSYRRPWVPYFYSTHVEFEKTGDWIVER